MHMITLYVHKYTICLQIEWLPHNTPLNTAVFIECSCARVGMKWSYGWLPAAGTHFMTCDACNHFPCKCFVAGHGSAAVLISPQTFYLSACNSGNVCVVIGTSEFPLCRNNSPNIWRRCQPSGEISLRGHRSHDNRHSMCFYAGVSLSRCVCVCVLLEWQLKRLSL